MELKEIRSPLQGPTAKDCPNMAVLMLSALFLPRYSHAIGSGTAVRTQPSTGEGPNWAAFRRNELFSSPGASVCWVGLFYLRMSQEARWPRRWVMEFIIACGLPWGRIVLH